MVDRFGEAQFVVFTYQPRDGALFSREVLDELGTLVADIGEVEGVRQVTSLFDAPLLRSPPIPLAELANGYRTLRSGDVDLALAQEELQTSPLFSDLLVSTDGRTTALRVDLEDDAALEDARRTRDEMRAAHARGEVQASTLADAEARWRDAKEQNKIERAALIAELRAVRDAHAGGADIFIGGVPMVAADIIDFVRRDMLTFGGGVVLLMAGALWAFFRRLRWVLIPLGTVSVTTLIMIGLLGFLDRPATAISGNFVALIAIITISFTIHLITRYRELCITGFSDDHVELVYEAMRSKLAPCVYTGLTTMVAFASLITSDIVPVIEFGAIMCVGIVVAFLVTYSFFAGILVMIPYSKAPKPEDRPPTLTVALGELSVNRPWTLLGGAVLLAVVGGFGVSKLSLENRFLDYFRESSEIHQGLEFIDRELGGTIPIDVVLEFEPYTPAPAAIDDDFENDFADDDFGETAADPWPERYWFTPKRVETVARMQAYLDSRPEIGKTLSVSTLERVARTFNDDEPLSYLQLSAVLALVPDEVRRSLIDPYASPTTGELRISGRIHETGPGFSKDALIRDIERHAVEELGFAPDAVHVTGMTVLFNDMLRALFTSQTSTLLFVLVATLAMFAVLLRSVTLAVVGLVPNLLAPLAVLAFMGFVGIPLDMMTITIAAIVIGIGVDDAIHYLHRCREEREAGHDAATAVRNSHRSIGNALYFTSLTVFVGFSVLSFSSFVPTVYFGWLTAVAMGLALLVNLTVLPSLLVKAYR